MNWRKYIAYPLLSKYQKSTELNHYYELRKSQFLSHDKLNQIQLKKLQILTKSAYDYVPYYNKLFNNIGFVPSNINSKIKLNSLPILERKTVQEQNTHFISRLYKETELIQTSSGGSTGDPVKISYSKDNLYRRHAAAKRHDEWAGFNYGEKIALIWGARKDFQQTSVKKKLWSFLTNNILVFDSSSITDENLNSFVSNYNKFSPKCVQGYAQSLVLVANFIKDRKIKLKKPLSVISSAELLTDNDRKLIEQTFDAPVYNRYGSRETSIIASECENHNMHVRDEDLIVEILREDGTSCNYDEEGEIVLTDLTNHAFPLIRYRIGDTGILHKNMCSCGRQLSTMNIKSGRVTDFLITPLNRKVSGVAVLGYICSDLDGISKVQFHQKDRKRVNIKILPNDRFNTNILKTINERIIRFLDNIEADIEVVNKLEQTINGKYRMVISDVN